MTNKLLMWIVWILGAFGALQLLLHKQAPGFIGWPVLGIATLGQTTGLLILLFGIIMLAMNNKR